MKLAVIITLAAFFEFPTWPEFQNLNLFPNSLEEPAILNSLSRDSIWLNDDIPFTTTQSNVIAKLGQPDSISTPYFECGTYVSGEDPWGENIEIWHYQGSQIVTFKEKAELMAIKPAGKNWSLHHPNFIFSKNTTLDKLAAVFPLPVSKTEDWRDSKDGRIYQLVRISAGADLEDQWILKFYFNKLEEMEYWSPCL